MTSTCPWPNPFSARWITESAFGTLPVRVTAPAMTKSRPTPWAAAACGSASAGIWVERLANVVLQDWANASVTSTVPSARSCAFVIARPCTVNTPGQSIG